MKLYERWQHDYHHNRYLEFLDDEKLKQRANDILVNVLIINKDCKISLRPPTTPEGLYWAKLWTEVLQEFCIRFGPYPAGFKDGSIGKAHIPKPTNPIIDKAIKAVKGRELKEGTYLVKYGDKLYLEPLVKSGNIRLSPASSYNDPSLNHAIRDDELSCSIHLHPSKVTLEVVDPQTGKTKRNIKPVSNVTMTLNATTNYYVYCLSTIYAPRLFADFEANACVLIINPHEYMKRLVSAVRAQLKEWDDYLIRVSYFDPLQPRGQQIDSFSCKHFRYAYQKEWRLVWLPPEAADELCHINLAIGSLEDACELIVP